MSEWREHVRRDESMRLASADDIVDLDIDALRGALAARRLSPVEVVSAFTSRSIALARLTHCFSSLDQHVALAAARRIEAESGVDGRALAGIPFGYKDVFADGLRSPRAGSRFDDLHAEREPAAALDTLAKHGAIGVGALALDEFSYGATGLNPHCGHVRNPWDLRLIAGGSSGGAAAAVAGRAVPFSLATDTGGSIRIPAALCGVVGLKPTFGSVDVRGMVPLSPSQDTIGIIARSADDCAQVLRCLRQSVTVRTTTDRGALPLAGVRIAIGVHEYFDVHEVDVATCIDDALAVFECLGATLHALPLRGINACDAAATAITSTEVSRIHRERLRDTPHLLSDATRLRLEAASRVPPEDYARALALRSQVRERFVKDVFSAHDVLVCPVLTARAQPIAVLERDAYASVQLTTSFLKSNRCFNYLGLPALSMPIGFDHEQMPVGLQLIGRPWSEDDLLRYCGAYQKVTDWHLATPPASWTYSNATDDPDERIDR
jgi:aspartyl-tRNA(Asn)/glutamyl-tRNA(Gln) amidotransferase subunit A